jgi:hypothetical protein
LHTNRELEFMLARGKPLAHFSESYPPEPDEEIVPNDAFAPHVLSGLFVQRLYVELIAPDPKFPEIQGIYHALYARADEAWRIDAYIAMKMEVEKVGWSERFERLQGSLLGYSDHENDMNIEHLLAGPMVQRWPWLRTLAAERR